MKKHIWRHRESCADQKNFPTRPIFSSSPPYYSVWKHQHLFGSFVQIMLQLCCAHLISLHLPQVPMDEDGASSHKINFVHNIRRLKFWRESKLHHWFQSYNLCWIWLNSRFHVQYKITNFHYLIKIPKLPQIKRSNYFVKNC